MKKKILFFTSPTCVPCKMLKQKLYAKIGQEKVDSRITYIDVSLDDKEVASTINKYNVNHTPTIIVLDDLDEMVYSTGVGDKESVEKILGYI